MKIGSYSAICVLFFLGSSLLWAQALPQERGDNVDPAPDRSQILRPSQQYLSPEQQIRFGYGSHGFGPRIPAEYRDLSDESLREKADAGDAGAAHMLWQSLQGAERLDDAEDVAVDQARINGHTFLLQLMGARYHSVDNPRSVVAWKACKDLGDALCGDRYNRVVHRYAPDPAWVERDAARLLERIRPKTAISSER